MSSPHGEPFYNRIERVRGNFTQNIQTGPPAHHAAVECCTIFPMCGRYTLSKTEELRRRFGIETDGFELRPRFNVCPEQTMPVIVSDGAPRVELMQWGLIPFWSKEPKALAINARI